jgi:hypothetical protein
MIEITLEAANSVEAAILKAGGVTELARLMEVSRESIRLWRHAGEFPDERLESAIKATGLSRRLRGP